MELILTNVQLTGEERALLRNASSNDTIVGGLRALIDDWKARGRPEPVTRGGAEEPQAETEAE